MATTAYPTDPSHLADVVQLQAAGLRSCVESLSHDWQSLLGRMKVELMEAEARIAEADITDPITGLMNRREMERQIQAQREQGTPEVLIVFSFNPGLPDEIVHQMAQRLVSQFRHTDIISRWSGLDFLVLFRSTLEIAGSRLDQILAWAGGRYLSDTGNPVDVQLQGRVMTYEEALAL
jgi:GGDEF domain-containing protein